MVHDKVIRAVFLGVALTACSKGAETSEMSNAPTEQPAAVTPAAPVAPPVNPHETMPGMTGMPTMGTDTPGTSQPEDVTVSGTVLETIDIASSKTMYYQLDLGKGETVWVAAKQIDVKKGDQVKASEAIEMRDFASKTLNRTFARLLMASEIEKLP